MKKSIKGLSLISLVIGVALSSIIFMNIGGFFSTSKANQSTVNSLGDLNEVAKSLQKNIYDIMSSAGYMNPDATTGTLPGYSAAFVESNYTSAPGGVAPSNGIVLGYFNYNSVNTNLWIKAYGSASGIIRSCAGVEAATVQDFRIILFTQTFGGQTGFYCAKQTWGQTAAAAMATATTLIEPDNYDSMWLKYGLTSYYLGCYTDTVVRALPACATTTGTVNTSYVGYSSNYLVASCKQVAMNNGYTFFGVQDCHSSVTSCVCSLGNSYVSAIMYGPAANCPSSQLGDNFSNSLYILNGALSKWVDPINLGTFIENMTSTGTAMTTKNVQAVRYAFLLKSKNDVYDVNTVKNFEFMENSSASKITRNDKKAYKLVTITVPLTFNILR
jgi:Tfp pilus assembly protein PilW